MKKPLRSFISFNRTERMGLVCLGGLLIVLLVIRATMSLWVHPGPMAQEQKLVAASATYEHNRPKPMSDTAMPKTDYQDKFDENTTPLPDKIDLNTTDSVTLVRLKGIGPATAHKIMNRRKNRGQFTSVEQLSEVGGFSGATFEVLKKHLVVH